MLFLSFIHVPWLVYWCYGQWSPHCSPCEIQDIRINLKFCWCSLSAHLYNMLCISRLYLHIALVFFKSFLWTMRWGWYSSTDRKTFLSNCSLVVWKRPNQYLAEKRSLNMDTSDSYLLVTGLFCCTEWQRNSFYIYLWLFRPFYRLSSSDLNRFECSRFCQIHLLRLSIPLLYSSMSVQTDFEVLLAFNRPFWTSSSTWWQRLLTQCILDILFVQNSKHNTPSMRESVIATDYWSTYANIMFNARWLLIRTVHKVVR